MLKRTFVILTFLLTVNLPAFADAPGLVNYQGRLRESGAPASGTKSMVFRLYDDPTGGAVVWTSDAVNVDVDRGVFSYKLGSHDPDSSGRYISNLAWSNTSVTYWLELTVDGKTLLPRERFTTVPFAFQATNSDTLDGYHAATFASTTTAYAIALSTGTIQAQVNSLALSTGTLQNQLNSVAGSTTSVQGQINALAVSTGSIQNQVNNLAYSTGTISANLASYSQLNATQTFTAQKTFLNQVTISSNAVITGSAGIGTAAPADKLHVTDGNVRIQGGTPILYLQNTDSPAGTASILNWQKNLIFKNGDGDERLQIREDNNVVINPTDGNVGIGTMSPGALINVNKSFGNAASGGATVLRVEGQNVTDNAYTLAYFVHGAGYPALVVKADYKVGIGTGTPASWLHIFQTNGTGNSLLLDTNFASGNTFAINPYITGVSNGGFSIRDVTKGTERLVIQYDTGNIGIGTTNPGAKLEVNGTIKISTGSIYTTTWTNVSFATGWYDYGSMFQSCQYKKVGDLVFLRGLATSGTNSWSTYPTICTLPAGYRPSKRLIFAARAYDDAVVRLDVDPSGGVMWDVGGNGSDWISLDGIVFSVD